MDCGSCIEHAAQVFGDTADGEVEANKFDGPGVGGTLCVMTGENIGGALDGSGGTACSVEMIDGP